MLLEDKTAVIYGGGGADRRGAGASVRAGGGAAVPRRPDAVEA